MSSPLGILEWRDGHQLGGWPLAGRLDPAGFLVDASFWQLDGFVPVLSAVTVGTASLDLDLLVDEGRVSVAVAAGSEEVRVTGPSGRALGSLVFGPGLPEMLALWSGRRRVLNLPFQPAAVQGVPSSLGLFSLQGLSGDVRLTGKDGVVFFDQAGQEVTWNAGALPAEDPRKPLLSLNGIRPVGGALYLRESALLKAEPRQDKVRLSLPAALNSSVVIPTLPGA
jgi:hypothetical protein